MNKVTIDGKWTTPNEWEDANELPYKRGNRAYGYFCIKDDGKFLYVLIDFVDDNALDFKDWTEVKIDTSNDKSSNLKPDDYVIALSWRGDTYTVAIGEGNKTKWIIATKDPPGMEAVSSNETENNPYSTSSHLIYEFAIPKDLFESKSEVGFTAVAANLGERDEKKRYIVLPDGWTWNKPSTWAKLSLVTPYEESKPTTTTTTTEAPAPTESLFPQIPGGYFTIIGIIAVVVIAIVAVMMLKKKK